MRLFAATRRIDAVSLLAEVAQLRFATARTGSERLNTALAASMRLEGSADCDSAALDLRECGRRHGVRLAFDMTRES